MPPRKPNGVDIRRRADGSLSYRIRWRLGGGRDGIWASHTFPSRTEAIDALRSIELAGWQCFCAKHVPPGAEPSDHYGAQGAVHKLTFGSFAHRHVAALTGVGKGYRAQFERELSLHMGPFLDVPLADITDMMVRRWIVELEKKLSPTTIRRLVVQASSVMTAGQADGLVTRNPFKGHRLARRDRDQHSEMRILTPGEWGVLADALPEGTYRDLATVLVGTGLRFNECAALWCGAVDPDARPEPLVHVARAWVSNGSSGWDLGVPKSLRSRRSVPYGKATAQALARHLDGRERELVFMTPSGTPVRHSNFYHRVWRPSVAAAGLDGLRIHDLRHTNVSWLLAAGIPIMEISRRLGHESITTTADRYGHLLPSAGAAAVAALDEAMPPRRDDEPPPADEGPEHSQP